MFGLLLLAFALSMDAFAAAICQGAVHRRPGVIAVKIGLAFGLAQGVMPIIGWWLGLALTSYIQTIDHWIALLLLGLLGGRMIREGLEREAGECAPPMGGWQLLVAAVATSIDAAAAGVTLPMLGRPILLACGVIGVTTALVSAGGVWLGSIAGTRLGKPAELLGGAVLIGLGVKIFVQHQFFGG
jgi:putative Mn2+ efflux pump MntP